MIGVVNTVYFPMKVASQSTLYPTYSLYVISLLPKIVCNKIWGGGWGVPMSHVDCKKWLCRPVEFKKSSCRPVDFKKSPCHPVEFKRGPCRMSLSPRKGRVALSILGVRTPKYDNVVPLDIFWTISPLYPFNFELPAMSMCSGG